MAQDQTLQATIEDRLRVVQVDTIIDDEGVPRIANSRDVSQLRDALGRMMVRVLDDGINGEEEIGHFQVELDHILGEINDSIVHYGIEAERMRRGEISRS